MHSVDGNAQPVCEWGRMALTASHHEFGGGHHAIETTTDRSFGIVFAIVFALLAAYLSWRGQGWWWVLLVASMVVLTLALVRPSLLAHLNWVWTRLGLLIGAIVAPVVMAVIFFGVVTPIGLFARVIGKHFLYLRRDPAALTYWLARDGSNTTPESLRDQF